MGATNIEVTARGRNMQEAFHNAQADAEEEYGTDPYNGEINNCSLLRDVTNKQGEFDERDHFHEWIWKQTNKRDMYGYCTQKPITNNNKIKTVVTNHPQKGARKFETRYIAVNKWASADNKYPGISEKTQTEAIKKARAYVEKNPRVSLSIEVIKVLVAGAKVCAEIKYKAASNERLGSYTFVGYAPC